MYFTINCKMFKHCNKRIFTYLNCYLVPQAATEV